MMIGIAMASEVVDCMAFEGPEGLDTTACAIFRSMMKDILHRSVI